MKNSSSTMRHPLRLLVIAAAMMCVIAHADEYTDVSQLVRSGKLSEALIKADLHLASKPKDPQMRFLKGVIQRDAGKIPEAIATFSRLTEDYPELPEPYNNLAVLYAGQSQFDKARAALEMAIRTNPSYATAHENLGDVYAKLASQAYNKALQLDAANPAVPPKLALIRELFNPATGAKGQRPTLTPPAAPPAPLPLPLPLPGPVGSKTPAALPAPPVVVGTNATPSAPASPPVAAPAAPAQSATVKPNTAPTAATPNAGEKEAEAAVREWASAWAAKDIKGYLSAYGKEFVPPGSMKRGAWEEERRQRISSKSKISVKLERLVITVNGNKAVANFRQAYKADQLAVSSHKTLDLVKNGEHWQIIKESTAN